MVGLVLGSAIVAVAYELWTGPAPAGVVEIRTAVWTTACAPSQPAGCLAPPVSQLDGTCLDLAGSFPVGSQVRCNIVSHIPAYVSGVGVAYPFAVIGYPKIATYGCYNCVTLWVDLALPLSAGNYTLTGTIYFS